MKSTHLMRVFVGILVYLHHSALANEPIPVTKMFQPSQMLYPNPERGWITHRLSNNLWGIQNLRNSTEKVSLILIQIDLSAYVNSSHIGQSKLNEIRTALNQCRQQGLKVLLRSAYDWHGALAPDPKDIEIMKNHVLDMKPIYYEYEYLIVAVEMGMFGSWGEMHSSSHSTITTKLYYPIQTGPLRQIHATYMLALPPRLSVLVRRPYYIRQLFNDNKPLTAAEAYSELPKARTGYHNDAYLTDITDGGTFGPGLTRAQELTYINQLTRFSFFGGESYGTPNGAYNNGNNAMLESRQQHMTYLHRDYYKPIYAAWGNAVQDEFTRQLGYRFQFNSLSYSKSVAPGGIFHFSLKLQNTGFSAMHLRRPVNLIMDTGRTTNNRIRYETTLNVDCRTWTPEANTITIEGKLRIPATTKEGTWNLYLALPDSSNQLQNDARYAVQFANMRVWNDDGTNLLADDISITSSAAGSRTNDNTYGILEIVTLTS